MNSDLRVGWVASLVRHGVRLPLAEDRRKHLPGLDALRGRQVARAGHTGASRPDCRHWSTRGPVRVSRGYRRAQCRTGREEALAQELPATAAHCLYFVGREEVFRCPSHPAGNAFRTAYARRIPSAHFPSHICTSESSRENCSLQQRLYFGNRNVTPARRPQPSGPLWGESSQ